MMAAVGPGHIVLTIYIARSRESEDHNFESYYCTFFMHRVTLLQKVMSTCQTTQSAAILRYALV